MEFKKYKLRELATVDISSVDKKTKEGEKSVRLCNFTDVYKNWAIRSHMHDSFMKATAKQKDIDKFSIHKGQVAITKDSETRDDIGIPTYIADAFNDVVLGYHCALITPHENFSGAYLNAYLNTKMAKKYFEGYASGSGQRYTLTLDSLNDIQIWAPETREDQEKIVKILNDIDQKIILNTRINAELEAMAKQLYDYWFVQFDFPDENGKPYKSSGGKMVWNEKLKREIPEGWEVVLISNLISEKKAGDWGQDEMKGSYILKVNCIRGADFKNPTNAPERYINCKNNDRLLEEDDIIVEISGGSPVQATGRSVYVSKGLLCHYDNSLTCSNFCQALTCCDKTIAPYFFYMWNMFYDNNIMFNYEGKTSGIKNLLIDMFLNNSWYLPPCQILSVFATTIKRLMSTKDSNVKEINHLTHLRDSLLPMLMNGQVTIE